MRIKSVRINKGKGNSVIYVCILWEEKLAPTEQLSRQLWKIICLIFWYSVTYRDKIGISRFSQNRTLTTWGPGAFYLPPVGWKQQESSPKRVGTAESVKATAQNYPLKFAATWAGNG